MGRDGQYFKRLYFQIENGGWTKTDLCKEHRNFARWERAGFEIGSLFGGLEFWKDGKTIDADSKVYLLARPRRPDEQLGLL